MRRPTEDEVSTLITLVRGGAPLEVAVGHIGRDPAEFALWLRKRTQGKLRLQLQRASAQANLTDLAIVANASQGEDASWQAARARLEMRQVSERESELHSINAIALGR